jgi:hypothetical protein
LELVPLSDGNTDIQNKINGNELLWTKTIVIKNQICCFCLPPAYLLVLAEIISSTLKMEAICSSEKPVATQETTRRHIPEDDTLHNHRDGYAVLYILGYNTL